MTTALVAFLTALPVMADPLEATEAYARTARPNAPSGAAYMVLTNISDASVTLIGVESDIAARVELHSTTEDESGVMQMRQIEDGIEIAPGEAIEFRKGADHIMLMGLTEAFKPGASFDLTLIYESAEPQTIAVPIAKMRKVSGG
ncbi:MAG: copper chaperone PCu(A)C [Alphaproteobacteria bacterium]|nr:copper chaperone PCu(A)C [Alphaproteobacteria bacterium]